MIGQDSWMDRLSDINNCPSKFDKRIKMTRLTFFCSKLSPLAYSIRTLVMGDKNLPSS